MPRKRFGQNFLRDDFVIQRIVEAIAPKRDEHLVEIGPGQGAITGPLLGSGCQLDVIELDWDLAPRLERLVFREKSFGKKSLSENGGRLRVHQADALGFDYATLSRNQQPLRLVGNLPYNISTPLLFHLLDFAELIEDMHFMLQLEVAERLCASPGGKTWGKLGVMVQYHCEVEKLFEVPPEAFAPAPKVRSAFLRLRPRRVPERTPEQAARMNRVVGAAFAHRRKTLRNNLRGMLEMERLEALGISPGARAESLSLEQFESLSASAAAREKP